MAGIVAVAVGEAEDRKQSTNPTTLNKRAVGAIYQGSPRTRLRASCVEFATSRSHRRGGVKPRRELSGVLRRQWAWNGAPSTRRVVWFAVVSAPGLIGMAGRNWGRCGCTFTQSTHDLDLWADGRPHSHGRSRIAAPRLPAPEIVYCGDRSFLFPLPSLWLSAGWAHYEVIPLRRPACLNRPGRLGTWDPIPSSKDPVVGKFF